MRNKQGEPYSYLTCLLCKNSQPAVQGGKAQVEPDFNRKVEQIELRVWQNQGRQCSQNEIPERRELYRESSQEICRQPPSSIQEIINQSMHVRKLTQAQRTKHNHEKKQEESLPDSNMRSEIVPIPISQTEQPQNSWHFLLVTQKDFASVVGNNQS